MLKFNFMGFPHKLRSFMSPFNIKLKIRDKLLLFYAVIILFVVLTTCFESFYVSINKATRDMVDVSVSLAQQRLMNIENLTEEIELNIFNLYNNSKLQSQLLAIKLDQQDYNDSLMQLEIYAQLSNIMYSTPAIDSIMLMDLEGKVYYAYKNNMTREDGLEEALEASQDMLVNLKGKCRWSVIENDRIVVQRMLYNSAYIEKLGFLSVEVNRGYLTDMLNLGGTNNNFALMDTAGELYLSHGAVSAGFWRNLAGGLGKGGGGERNVKLAYNDEMYNFSILGSKNSDWIIINAVSDKMMRESWNMIILIGMGIAFFAFLIAFLFVLYISSKLSININALLQRINDISVGRFYNDINLESNDEISLLGYRLNELGREMDRLVKKSVHEEQSKRELEVKMLRVQCHAIQAQLNPHFIYNSLESISSFATIKGVPEISTMVCSFANLIRTNVKRYSKYVTLKEEVEYLKNYVKFYKFIYPRRIAARFDIEKHLEKVMVPSFLLQPLVENSIVYGVEKYMRKIRIAVRCYQEDEQVIIEVQDDSVGIARDALDGLVSEIENGEEEETAPEKHARVGLRSVNRIIKLLYGDAYGMRIDSELNVGTSVRLNLPLL